MLNEKDSVKLIVIKDNVLLESKNNEKIFKLWKILFCVSYKKVFKVVVFNYLLLFFFKWLECYVFLCGLNEDVRCVVVVFMMVFRVVYKELKCLSVIYED